MLNVKDNKTMMYTDLAVEIQEECSGRQGEIPGVVLEQYKEDGKGIRVTKIQIQTADGAKRMGRPIGNYMTLESADKEHSNKHSDKNLSGTKLPDTNLLASYINGLLPSSAHSFLIVGLGNANMTADALGPLTIEKMAQSGMASYTSMIVPGVFAQTGMESCEIIQGIVQQTSPDCIITIDALAARSAFRLGTTVQLTDTGIRPGSGVGNARKGITKENMKIPVIAIGIPTVVSAAAIVSDAMDSLKQIGYNETILGSIAMLDKEEYYQLISEVFAPELGSLFVMPKNLDEELDTMSSLLAASLSQVICKR
ncbi:GPR endopeptidase [Anthropogastromicrobium aceti]|uniref:Germination protease n=1 Tax=Anthropogastromicrobium aceti TaxID=2981768 RepID=A0AAE3E5P7_9FIRM|nr:GPR endopeptidase [Anthropogastromicrobium aceti]MCC2222290.1 GPR endopeptidase [Anthropogastromicrobium aceti]